MWPKCNWIFEAFGNLTVLFQRIQLFQTEYDAVLLTFHRTVFLSLCEHVQISGHIIQQPPHRCVHNTVSEHNVPLGCDMCCWMRGVWCFKECFFSDLLTLNIESNVFFSNVRRQSPNNKVTYPRTLATKFIYSIVKTEVVHSMSIKLELTGRAL